MNDKLGILDKKRVVLITGASRGIGQSCALELANKDTVLILPARNPQDLKETSAKCIAKGAQVYPINLDLSKIEDIKPAIEKVIANFGSIDILINNAGIWIEKPFLSGEMNEWDTALDVNLKSIMHLTRYSLEKMKEGSSIIFIGSTASKRSYAGGTNYCAAKFGLLGFAGSLFEDIRAQGIKVCSIFPGVVNTDMHKGDKNLIPEKMIQPGDIAQTVNFLLSMPLNVCPTEITLQPQFNPKVSAR